MSLTGKPTSSPLVRPLGFEPRPRDWKSLMLSVKHHERIRKFGCRGEIRTHGLQDMNLLIYLTDLPCNLKRYSIVNELLKYLSSTS